MNIENNHDHGLDPQGQPYQKPSGGGKLLKFGGCGCLLFLLLCGGGIGAIYMYYVAPYQEILENGANLAEASPAVQAKLGSPVTVERQQIGQSTKTTDEGLPIQVMSLPISGPDGSGTLNIEVEFSSMTEFKQKSITVEVDGETIDLMSNAGGLMLDVSDGIETVDPAEEGSDPGT